MFDVVTAGHFAIDLIKSPTTMSPKPTLGGPAAYVSCSAARLGAKVAVISKVGNDFPKEYVRWLNTNHVDLSGLKQIKSALTTRFILRYQHDWKRKLQLKALAPPILPNDILSSLQTRAVHLAPIAHELSEETIIKLRKSTRILSFDPQGFVRHFDSNGNVRLEPWKKKQLLEIVDIYKSSKDELRMITGTRHLELGAKKIRDCGVKVIIVTRAMQGSTLLFEDCFYNIPACKPRAVLDPTGAGDVFVGAFLAEYVRGKDPLWCACTGSASASFVVEAVGPERFGEKEETYERANEIYGKLVRK